MCSDLLQILPVVARGSHVILIKNCTKSCSAFFAYHHLTLRNMGDLLYEHEFEELFKWLGNVRMIIFVNLKY